MKYAPAICFCVFVTIPSILFGQSGNATLTGTIHDSSGAVVPNAKVTATNTATGVPKETVSNSSGLYVIPNLIPGPYDVNIAAPSFQTKKIQGVTLHVDQQATVDVELTVGSVSEQVVVTGTTPILQAEEASVGTVIQGTQVRDLPLNGRYFTQLLQLVPGTVQSQRTPGFASTDPSKAGVQRNGMPVFDVNGQSGGYTYYRIDGIENTEREFGGANIPVSIDAIQEFKLQTANFSAEYGRGPAQVDIVVKSGTNQLHGTLFEFLRNDDLDAMQWAYTGPHSKRLLKRNQFGGSLGGPIKRDKLFWFFNYDGTREVFSAPQTVTVPTNDMRNGIFPAGEVIYDWQSGQQFPNNTIPKSRMDPTTQKVLAILPAPNLAGVAVTNSSGLPLPATNNYFFNPTHQQTINQETARIDYTISERDSITGRYTYSPNTIIGYGPLATNIQNSLVGYENAALGGQNLSAGWFHNFSPTTINEFRFGFLTDPQNYAKGDTTDYPKQFGLDQFLYPGYFTGLPHFQIGSVNLGSGDYRPLQVGEQNYQAIENLTIVRGAHSIRVGGDFRRTRLVTNNSEVSTGRFYFNGAQTRDRSRGTLATTTCPGGTSPTGCTNGDAMADFLLGYLSYYEAATPILQRHKYFSAWSGYVNDTWHVTPKFTATIGLRYDYLSRFHADPAAYAMPVIQNGVFAGKIAVPDPGGNLTSAIVPGALDLIPNSVVGCSTVGLPSETCLVSEKNDWQPRLGLAYQVTPKTVFRAAGGIFYGYFFGDLDTEDGEQFPFIIRNQTPTYTAPPTSGPPQLAISNPTATSAVPSPFIFSSLASRKLPVSYQFNATVERQIGGSMTLSVGYVGVLGRHLEGRSEYCCYYDMPQPWGVVLAPGQKQVQPDPRFSSNMLMWEDRDSSNYNALQAKFERRFAAGLGFTAAYTWSHSLTTINWIADPRYPQQQPTDADLRHNLVLSPIWAIPVGKGRTFLNRGGISNQVLGGWQMTAIVSVRSGFPFTPTLSGVNLLNMTKLVASVNLPDATCSGKVSNPSALNWYDKSCFTMPTEPTTPGAELREGNLGINSLRGPGGFATDFGLSKQFPFNERTHLDFRFEAFNFFNHPILGLPNTAIVPGNNTPASITYVLSLPRTLQFALKLSF
ncbi:MAG TPA: TonB-dependent receptor [Bryobacteraceae bacterium]|nr:TonB-dependent receptor [Bryobacteraceae bacterium]